MGAEVPFLGLVKQTDPGVSFRSKNGTQKSEVMALWPQSLSGSWRTLAEDVFRIEGMGGPRSSLPNSKQTGLPLCPAYKHITPTKETHLDTKWWGKKKTKHQNFNGAPERAVAALPCPQAALRTANAREPQKNKGIQNKIRCPNTPSPEAPHTHTYTHFTRGLQTRFANHLANHLCPQQSFF